MAFRSTLTTTLMAAMVAALLAAGCEKKKKAPECEGVLNLCETSSELRCSSDLAAIEVCAENEDGCLVWTVEQECAEGDECKADADPIICGCRDECGNPGDRDCNETVLRECIEGAEGCTEWSVVQDCAEDGLVCGFVEGTAQCTAACEDECEAEGDTRCLLDVVQVCTMQGDCLAWQDDIDCGLAGEVCRESGGAAGCVIPCTDECLTEGETQCSGTIIQECRTGADGCLDWVDMSDCSLLGLRCDDAAEPAVCASGSGESCTDVEVITGTTFERSGSDFTADYADDFSLTGTNCMEGSGAEAVFAIDLAAGQGILVRELGEIDVIISFQSDCGGPEACILSEDYGEEMGFRYIAAADERIYIIVEGYWADPTLVEYDIRVDVFESEVCGDSADNDIDGLTDCDDPDCFGDSTYCTTEANCGDGEDNDSDGDVDCADSDCTGSPWCAPYRGYWEQFDTGDEVDLVGHVITFTPDLGDVNLYTWEEATYGIAGYIETPGGGTATTELSLDDSDFIEYAFTVAGSFTFFGASYASMFVGSNGFVTFSEGDSYSDSSESSFFDYPRIAGFDDDLDPDGGLEGTITVDEYPDRIVVTFDALPEYWTRAPASFQIIMNADSHSTDPGAIKFYYLDIRVRNEGMIGISSGIGVGTYPPETDFVPPPPPTINEVAYDNPGADAAEFVEIHGTAGADLSAYTLVHFNGLDGSVLWAAGLTGVLIPPDGFLVIGPSGGSVPNVDVTWASLSLPETEVVENDGETLVLYTGWDGSTGTVIDALAWESGASLFGEGNPSSGLGRGDWNTSIGRYPDGLDTGDNLADFPAGWWTTPGEPNTPAAPAGHERIVATVVGTDTYPVAIPDNDTAGIDVTMVVDSTMTWFPATVGSIHVGVKVTHTYRGDLRISIASPAGTTVMLHDRSGGTNDDIKTVYDLATSVDDPTQSMDSFNGEATLGTWMLHLSDNNTGDVGQIEDWIIWVAAP